VRTESSEEQKAHDRGGPLTGSSGVQWRVNAAEAPSVGILSYDAPLAGKAGLAFVLPHIVGGDADARAAAEGHHDAVLFMC
jgi:hypothetical protein